MNIDTRSVELLENVTKGLDFSIPKVDFDSEAFDVPEALANALQEVPEPLTVDVLTERVVDGNGCFDAVMTAIKAHLVQEFEAGRITGAEYTQAYIAGIQGALQFSVQYLLGKDNAYYQALGAQTEALKGNIDAYTAKVQLAIAQAQIPSLKADYANKVLALHSTEEQVKLVEEQTNTQKEQTEVTNRQIALVEAQTNTQIQQKELLREQTEQAHSQTSDTRLDGTTPISGYTGNQNALLKQQVVSFKKDAIIKSAKIYADSFSTQLSMSAATADGTGLDKQSIGSAINKLAASMTY